MSLTEFRKDVIVNAVDLVPNIYGVKQYSIGKNSSLFHIPISNRRTAKKISTSSDFSQLIIQLNEKTDEDGRLKVVLSLGRSKKDDAITDDWLDQIRDSVDSRQDNFLVNGRDSMSATSAHSRDFFLRPKSCQIKNARYNQKSA